MNILTRIVASLALVTTAFAHASCESPRRASDPKAPRRAMWVTRFDYLTVADVEKVVADCKLAGINTILFQVRGNATAFYKSSFEPWAEQFHFKDPGFDPLETAIRAAHANGIELHAWVNVMPAWWGTEKPTEPRQIYNTKPEWFWYDQKGERQPLAPKFYVSLNPCLPEVRKYLVDVLKDLAEHYAIDGLHLDYTRFPNDAVPGVAPRPGIDFPRDKTTLSLFAKDTGKTPDKDAAAWNAWRAEQVTSLVRVIRAMLRAARPKAELSSAVGPVPENALAHHFQDAKTWLAEKLVDCVYPMNYTADRKVFAERSQHWKEIAGAGRVVMGVRLEGDPAVVHDELASAAADFRGYSGFAYSALFDSPNTAIDAQDAEARAKRAALRKLLLPLLQDLARSKL